MSVTIDTGDTGLHVTYKSATMQRIESMSEVNGYEIAVKAKMMRQLNMGRRDIDPTLSARVRADGNAWVEDRAALVRRLLGFA